MLRVENRSTTGTYGINHTPSMSLGVTPGAISGTGSSLVDRVQTSYGLVEKKSNTTRMGDLMLKRGVDFGATTALLEKIGHQNGMFDPSTGIMGFQGPSGENVTVRPILGTAARDQAAALASDGRTPIAWIEIDGEVKLAALDTATRELKFENHSTDTLKMGRMMTERGVDLQATRALLQAVGNRTGRLDRYTGEMTFNRSGTDVTITPIMTEGERNLAKVIAPKDSYPVAKMTVAGVTKLLTYNRNTGEIAKLSILHNLPGNIAEYRLHGEVPHNLRGVNAAMANNGVPLELRSSVLAYLQEQGVSSVITAPSEGRFTVTLNTGETFGTGY